MAKDQFNGRVQDALRVGFRAIGLIGESQKVEHSGLAVPPQARLDSAFYMLTRLKTLLSGQHLRPDLWPLYTWLKRSWTTLHVLQALWYRQCKFTQRFFILNFRLRSDSALRVQLQGSHPGGGAAGTKKHRRTEKTGDAN